MTRTALAAATTLAGIAALIAWLRRRFVVISVDGQSMRPTLHEGDRVLVRRRPLRHIRAGDIVVVERVEDRQKRRRPGAAAHGSRNLSDHSWLIKRAAAVPGDPVPASVAAAVPAAVGTLVPDGRLIVLGDNTASSIDSRHYGYLSGDGVLGVVVRQHNLRQRASDRERKQHRPLERRQSGSTRPSTSTSRRSSSPIRQGHGLALELTCFWRLECSPAGRLGQQPA